MWNAECGVAMKGRSPTDPHPDIPHSAFRIPHSALALGTTANLFEIFQSDQDIPWFRTVCRTQDSRQLQLIDYPRRPPVPDAHPPLQQRGRPELVLDADLGGLAKHRIAVSCSLLPTPRSLFSGLLRLLQRRHLV